MSLWYGIYAHVCTLVGNNRSRRKDCKHIVQLCYRCVTSDYTRETCVDAFHKDVKIPVQCINCQVLIR